MLYPDFNELVKLKSKASGLNISSNRHVLSSISGDYKSPFRGQGLEFEEVRQYVAGDDVRNIDWRVTARTGSPHMKIFTEERERTVIICVDANDTMRFGTRGTFKSVQAARSAALLGWCAHFNNDRVGTCLFGNVENGMQFFTPKRSRKSLWQMFTLLSEKTPNSGNIVPIEEMLLHLNKTSHTGALIFIISDFAYISEELEKQLGNLRKHSDVVLVAINDPADMNIAPIGNIAFSSGSNNLTINTNSKSGRDAYSQAAIDEQKKFATLALKLRIPVLNLATNRDVYGDLLQGLKYISKKRGRK